jgi:hypothetical protein
MNQSVKYRQNAAECFEAGILSDSHKKAKMIARAQSWILLADLAERNINLDPIYETPPRVDNRELFKLTYVSPFMFFLSKLITNWTAGALCQANAPPETVS